MGLGSHDTNFVKIEFAMEWRMMVRSGHNFAHNRNFVKVHFALEWKITIRSGPNFAHAMPVQLPWHVQNWDLIRWLESKLYIYCTRCTLCLLLYHGGLVMGLGTHDTNFVKIHCALEWRMMVRSGHNFADAMAAELSWHMQYYDLIGWLELELDPT